MKKIITFTTLLILTLSSAFARGTYQEPADFLNEVFANKVPVAKKMWLTGKIREAAKKILQHKPSQLRVRYWQQGTRSVWILNEIGKEQPITAGIIINNGKIERIKVLIFRESRGDEIRHPFFVKQFSQASLNKELQLDHAIDGISGATLSVRALTKLSRLALYLSQNIKS
ncbi:MAG TPA: FMN-binding protein [Gammaproteobacteria bacterium]|nr:FMN-binding protein [Gammaproteobacteria bacterium]